MANNIHPITPSGDPTARLENNELILDGFRERDQQVITLATDADDLEALVHDCLAVGARAMTAAQTTTDVAVVEKAFGEMKTAFERGLERFNVDLDGKTKELLDGENGALPRALNGFTQAVEELLGDTFDPDSKRSVIATFEEVMREAALEQLKAMRTLVDPDSDDSPLGRYRSEIVKTVEKEAGKLQRAVEELKTQLAVDEAKAEMFELTTKKGFTFEDGLEAKLIEFCHPQGDIAERVGGTAGARGKKGDFTVTISPDDVAGQDVCFTVEAKNKAMNLRDTLKELDRCIANRDALAGIAVFAKREQCPGESPFQVYGNRAIIVHDPTDGEEVALRLALAWARWVARRQLGTEGDSINLERIGAMIETARQSLRTHGTINRALTTSANKITEARNHLGSLVAEVEAALAGIEGEIAE